MKELDELLFSLNESLASGSLAIQGYDTVKDSFSITKARSSNMQTQGIVFDFSKFEKKYEKALSSNDFDKANSVIQEASGAMDVTSNKFAEASGIRDEMENLYDSLSKLDIPGKTFLDVIRKTDKFFSDGKYEDVVRMSEGNIQDMQHKIEWQKTSRKSIDHASEALEKGKKAGSKMETSGSFLEQAQVAFDKGDYVNADDLAQESAKESLSSNKAYSEALEHMNDARSEVSSFGDIVAVSFLKNMLSNIQENLSNEKFREVKTESKKVIAESDKLKKAMVAISNVRELISDFGNLADVSLLEEGLQELEGMLDNGEFHKVHKRSDILISQCSDLKKSSKPLVEFDFDRNNFVVGQTKKLTINFENKGNASAKDFSFEILDDEWAELKKISKNIERLDPGEKEDMIIYIKFKEEGQDIPFSYNIKFRNALTSSNHNFRKEEEIRVYGSIEQIGNVTTTTSVSEVQNRQVAEYTEWSVPPGSVTGSDAEALLDFLSSHRESYLRYPNNEKILNKLRKVKYDFPLYFEVPEEPKDILNEWGLPENLRGNVVLNDDRQDVLHTILEENPSKNFVIFGDPGIGKTVLLFEAFDKFMEKEPTGYLSNDNFNDLIHQNLGLRMFYDDLPENKKLLEAIESSDVNGLIVSSRKVDWEDLPIKIREKFETLEISKFDNKQMYNVCKSMLTFSGVNFSEGALKMLVEYADGSPIYVYSMIKELKSKQITRLQDEYIENNAQKGMHNYISSLLGRLLKEQGEYFPGGLHSLACLIFLSRELNERRCSPIFFIKFGEKLSEYTQDKLDDPIEKKLFTKVQQYMSGKGNAVRFPHDTWADVVDGEGQFNAFKADIDRILLEFQQTRIFENVKNKAAEEAWLTVSGMLRDNRNANIDRYLSVAETILHNYDIDQLSNYEWMDVDELRKTTAQYLNKPLAKNLNNILEKSQARQMNIMIKDSVVNRSNIGGSGADSGNVEISDSVINRSK